MKRPARLWVHIDRLVLEGAPEVSGDLLAASIVAELTRLGSSMDPPLEVPDEIRADLVRAPAVGGREIAAALHARLAAEVARA
jgi:hypothetical protein